MTTLLRVKSLTSFVQANLASSLRFLTFSLVLLFAFVGSIYAQTTYTWNGGAGAWNVAANWTPTRTTPAATDILQFNSGGTYTVTAMPSQTIGGLLVTNNTNVTIVGGGNQALTITGIAGQTTFLIESGSSLTNTPPGTASTIALTANGQVGEIAGTFHSGTTGTLSNTTISGTLNLNVVAMTPVFTINNTTYPTRVTSTGVVNHTAGSVASSAASLIFEAGSTYNYLATTTAINIPTATWNTTSTVNITGVTTITAIGGFSGQSFGNFTYNCPSQTVTASLGNATTTTAIKGNLTIANTGSGTVSLGTATNTLAINGNLVISGGTFDLCTGGVVSTINLDGNYNQTAGTLTRTNAANVTPINFRGTNATYTQSGGTVTNTYINYNLNTSGAVLTLNSGIVIATGRTFAVTIGTLYCGTNVISGAGTFTLSNVNTATLGIGDPNGITPQASGTGGTAGNIRTTTRTFNISANYIYTGTNGQVTGTGLQATAAGYIQVDMQNNSDALTFSNTALSGIVNVRLKRGVLGNAITYTNVTNSTLTYEGASLQTTTNNEFPAANGPRSLVINNASGVTLHAARTLGNGATNSLTMTNGNLNTTTTNVLTIANVTATGVSGGSATSYVNGPLNRNFNTSTGTFSFPVGKTGFGEIDLIVNNSPGATATYQVEYFETTPTGSIGTGLSALGNSYWRVQRTTGTGTLTGMGVTLTKSGIVTDSRIGFSPDNAGTAYINIGGSGPAASISSTTNTNVTADGYYTVGTSGTLSGTITSYTTLTSISNALSTMLVTGNVIFELPAAYAGEPAYPVTFNQFNTDGTPWTVTIRPAAGSPVLTTAGDPNTGNSLIELNGVDRLTFDGRAGGAGSTVGWIFRNTRTAALVGATFRYQNDATSNTLTYLQIEGQNISSTSGTVFFSTSPSGSLGNSNNTVSFCEIRDRVTGGTALPMAGVYSAGTSTAVNSNNTISDCLIYNYYTTTTSTFAGIKLEGNTSAWTIQNNKFYQTASRAPAAVQPISAIYISNTSGNNFVITGNQIGGDNASGSGTTTYNSATTALGAMIYLNVGSTPSSLVQNNTITNISFTTTSGSSANYGAFSAIYLAAGSARILNNTIGASSGTNAITVTISTNTGGAVNAIKSDATGTVRIENNTIGSISAVGTGTNNAVSSYGIHFTAGDVVVKNNTIGSATPSSMQITGTATTNTGILAGINATAGAAYTDSLVNNTLSNLRNNNGGTGTRVAGITASGGGRYLIDDNEIWNLSTPSTSTGTTTSASVMGISLSTGNTQALSISGNLVHSLVNNSAANTSIIGIYYSGGSSTSNRVDRNFVHTFTPSTGTSSPLIGIQLASAVTSSNNMVRLGIQPGGSGITQSALIYGIDLTSTGTTNIFHNTVYITGAVAGVTATNSFAFRRTATTGTHNIQNNIFVNTRTQSSGGKHYAIYTPNITTFTSDYNVLYATGTGTYTGLFNTTDALTLANWRTSTTNRDLNSLACDPNFINENGDESNVNLHIDGAGDTPIEGRGNPAALSPSITIDFDGVTRDVPALNMVDIGADAGNFTARRAPSLSPTANGSSPLTTCVNSAVSFAAVPSGGATCGTWEYSWYNGTNYWNGTSFASVSEVFNTSWENINVLSLSSGSAFTVRVRCSGDTEGCIAPQQGTVNVTLNGATTLTAAIGNPANGLSHNMNLSWTAAAGASGYELEVSTNNVSWSSIYSGTNLSYTHNAGDNPNVSHYYRVRAVYGMTNCNWINATQFPIYTAADAPALPVLSNPTPYTLDLTLANETPVVNPAITTYSIYCTTTSQYVQANGSLGASEVFQTKAVWGTVTVTGLIPSTNYCFYAKARNNDGDIRVGQGGTIYAPEAFTTNANFATAGNPTNRFYSPSSCTTGGLLYLASGGCPDGSIGKSGTFTNSFGCYLRTPSINCTGNTSTVLTFDVSNSYFASQPLDRIRFYMFADGVYKTGACTSVKIGGVEVSTTSGSDRFLPHSVARNCTSVDVTFDMTTTTDLTDVLFYIEPSNGYNNSNLYSVAFDNVSLFEGVPDVCLSTAPLILNGGYTVGTGGDYPSLTNPGGLFEAINMAQLSGNVTASIISDLTAETGQHPLNQWVEQGIGGYTLTIQPSNNTTRTIEGTYVGAAAASAGLYRFNGADRVIIDGRDPSNLAGNGRHLLFRNLSATSSAFNSTFNLINDATNNTFRYCVIEGSTIGATNGVFRISTAGAGNGNDDNTISNCQLRDRSNAVGNPLNIIYALGTSGKENSNITISNNEIFNFWATGTSTNGILIGNYNLSWDITGNSFYQTASRAASATVIHYGIQIDNSSGNGDDFQILNNYIGGTAASAGGTPWTITGTSQVGFIGISVNTTTSSSNLAQGNTVANFNIASSRISAFPTNVFIGILASSNGGTSIDNNTIGSDVGNGSITINNVTSTGATVVGIGHSTSSGTVNITNNKVGSFTITSGGAFSVTFNGIRYGQGNSGLSRNISGNLIGSLSTANSINVNTASSNATAQDVVGIYMTGGANAVSITNNTIANMNNNRPTTGGGQIVGINSTFATNTITGNTIYNLTTNSNGSGTGTSASAIGILLSATSANGHVVSQNTIYAVKKNSGTTAGTVTGIYYGSSTGTNNTISRNLIHSLSSTATSGILNGIYMGAGSVTVSNNMVRLGVDETGASITTSLIIQGIVKDNTSSNNLVYYNSVYIGGTGVANSANSTYAFRRVQSNTNDNVRNNIFFNARSNATTGGSHYGAFLNASSSIVMSNNLIYANGTGAFFGRVNTTDYVNLAAWTATGLGTATVSANPQFVAPTAGTPDLSLTAGSNNAAESGAVIISGIDDDYAATGVRTGYPQTTVYGGGTAPDMGADETDMIPVDLTPPTFVYTNISTQSTACVPITTTVQVTVNDPQSGISLASNLPRMYFRRRTGATTAWSFTNSVQGTFVSGTANSSVWTFTINYATYGITPINSNEFEYYFVAQDVAPIFNVGTSQTNGSVPVHSDVVTLVTPANYTFPASGSYTFAGTPLSGMVTVGSGGTYPRFNGSGGLFEAINNNGLSSNLDVVVISDIAELANWTPLNAHTEYCGTGYTITIRPNSATIRTIEANSSAANAMFSFYGANRVIIDGRFNGSGRYLRLRHNRITSIYASTVEYNNGADNNVLRSCIVEGANTNLSTATNGSVGVVRIGGSMGFANGELYNITIEDNLITNLSNIAPTLTNVPSHLIYIGGASIGANIHDITIRGNDFANFQESAVNASNGNSSTNCINDNLSITNNNIYQEIIIPTYQYPIYLDPVGTSKGHLIAGNKIGGSSKPSPNITGTYSNTKSDGEIVAIYVNVGDAPTQAEGTTIRDNIISNISLTGTNWGNFIGVRAENGRVNIKNNLIGSLASSLSSPNITCAGNGGAGLTDNTAVIGIWSQSTEEVVIDSNTVCGLSTTNGYSFLDGIIHGSNLYFNGVEYATPGGKATITNNQVLFSRSSSRLANLISDPEGFMGIFVWTNAADNLIANNKVINCGSGTSIFATNVRIHGMVIGVAGSTTPQTGEVRNNEIKYIFNENTGDPTNSTSRNPIIYGMSVGNGNWTISNNRIFINNGTLGGTLFTDKNTAIRAINDAMLYNQANCESRYYNNTVYVSGSNATGLGTANSTYAFIRYPIDYNLIAITAGAPITLRNNIFINDRGGQGNHRAIGNVANSNANAAINWNANASNYNFISAPTSGVSLWGTSTNYDLAAWRTNSGGDANSWSVLSTTGASSNTAVNASDLFNNIATGDLSIKTSHQASWFVNGKGMAGNNATDYNGDARTMTYGYGIDIGADEFTPDNGILPHAITATPALNGTNNFQFAGRSIGSITWGNAGTVPTTITARYFSGDEPGVNPSPAFAGTSKADFMTEFTPTGGSGYTYNAVLNFDNALAGDYTNNEGNMKMIKTSSLNWIDVTSTVDTVNNTLSTSALLSSFSFFSGGVSPSPLPIELLSFNANCAGDNVTLNWATATEINNQEFIIHRSENLMQWEEIVRVAGAGNSNQIRNYAAIDDRPLDGVAYYRLTQRDYDGTTESFNPVSVNCQSDGEGNSLSVYPNPATDNFKVSITVAEAITNATIEIIDINGKCIIQRNVNLEKGTTEFGFDAQGIGFGSYIVCLKSAEVIIKPVKLIIK